MGCSLHATGELDNLKVTGGKCPKGEVYAYDEITNPLRMICTTIKINGGIHPVIPVKTDKAIPDKFKLDVVDAVKDITLTSPVKMGDIIIEDIFKTGVDIVAERDM
jgi:CxxC motif-containing protein